MGYDLGTRIMRRWKVLTQFQNRLGSQNQLILNYVPEKLWRNIIKLRDVDSGCSRHMIGDISHLHDIQNFNGEYVSFAGREKEKITQMGTVFNDMTNFKYVNFVPESKHS
ncbi:hypothetical protein Lser_V15G32857 [Lactuca serriola]